MDIVRPLPYDRLCSAAILSVLDKEYLASMKAKLRHARLKTIPASDYYDEDLAEADVEDRIGELTGATKLVTSLAMADGLVLMSPLLAVLGFGVKIKSTKLIGRVYDGPQFARKGRSARMVDPNRFGTRHGSMLRYCREDPKSVGIVVSQDGHVRIILTLNRCLTLWDDVKLLAFNQDVRQYAREAEQVMKYRNRNRHSCELGYTSTPKTLSALMESSQ